MKKYILVKDGFNKVRNENLTEKELINSIKNTLITLSNIKANKNDLNKINHYLKRIEVLDKIEKLSQFLLITNVGMISIFDSNNGKVILAETDKDSIKIYLE